ncbi:MAG TPA: Gfo/Idh/MocA family oxidoreductase [Vitreimonas sp.]|uniref:Gfo/Idh/MocA family protein n=1 Tax=Vitreimonas sp. TaxID=3069702 RepID=UPI002D708488|nr:Gfo/Idh/MocA family oxidoreductase [Vitreimonas sp.]HYD88101.1 Gfo/Idh/MocA family oxidoreductase [Vitreimonas sp.]
MLPRLGFLGVGWIGRHRLQAILEAGVAEAAAIADPSDQMAAAALELASGARRVGGLEEMLELPLDGIVIATPSALHAAQSIAALKRGLAVFCQKPLGRNGDEVQRVLAAARAADRRLGIDLCYRHTVAAQRLRSLIQEGALGKIYAVDLVFHNAYGPDKPWFYDRRLSGGGCVADLGVHLVDLALWLLDWPDVIDVSAQMSAAGELLRGDAVEDYATAALSLANGAAARLACSWRLPVGQDAVISAAFYGAAGGAVMRNVNGSFYDFELVRMRGTCAEQLVAPPDAWGGRAAVAWAEALKSRNGFDPEIVHVFEVARALDRLYAAAGADLSAHPDQEASIAGAGSAAADTRLRTRAL